MVCLLTSDFTTLVEDHLLKQLIKHAVVVMVKIFVDISAVVVVAKVSAKEVFI